MTSKKVSKKRQKNNTGEESLLPPVLTISNGVRIILINFGNYENNGK